MAWGEGLRFEETEARNYDFCNEEGRVGTSASR
jgi:hypothetical protein